jgi:hypothetical protein
MMVDIVKKDPLGRVNHWYVNGHLVAGATTKKAALDLFKSVQVGDPVLTWSDIRAERDRLLLESDWTQTFDSSVRGDPAWLEYRQALRDITNAASPADVVWPVKPDA